ncbi:MAG: hypothetical protein HWE34_16000 [Methylocystaceae bacterium]|nr:hypothetical protein [Methylocystaceae bacterium]
MTQTVKLACTCGKVAGEVKIIKQENFHVKCLCCDCQNFATHLGHDDKTLDQHGGTELFQTYPAHVTITQGEEYIACLSFSPTGLLRFHTSCCNTPIGNMLRNPKMPFVGIPVAFMQFTTPSEKDTTLGPILMQAFAKYAKNGKPEGSHDRFPLSFMPKILFFMGKGFFQKKFMPSPYFKDGKPVSPPQVLTDKQTT